MVTVLGMWEPDWMDPARTERRLWKQTLMAFEVRRWSMYGPVQVGTFTSPAQYTDLDRMLEDHPGPRTLLIPPGRVDDCVSLVDYEHPEHATYVFGNSATSLVTKIEPGDTVVSIVTPAKATLFGHVALGAVLYDRMVKRR